MNCRSLKVWSEKQRTGLPNTVQQKISGQSLGKWCSERRSDHLKCWGWDLLDVTKLEYKIIQVHSIYMERGMDCHTYIYIHTNHRSLRLEGENNLFRIAIINHFTNKINYQHQCWLHLPYKSGRLGNAAMVKNSTAPVGHHTGKRTVCDLKNLHL